MSPPRVGVAISGGGFRATCFGLGCLRALHDHGVLQDVKVISGISGGSLIAAMYAYGPTDFSQFETTVVEQLRRGIELEILARALRPDSFAASLIDSSRASAANLWQVTVGKPKARNLPQRRPLRSRNRTDALRDTLASRVFGRKIMPSVTHSNLDVVISATDLGSMNAVRFGSEQSSCSPFGSIVEQVEVAEAVAASAAYPLALPPIERHFRFRSPTTGSTNRVAVLMTDGGVYDNLGISVLEPGRSGLHTSHVYDLDYIISCDAGQGRPPDWSGIFLPVRMKRSFDLVHRRTQNAARARLYEWVRGGLLRGVVHAYLGMDDQRLPMPTTDLVPSEKVRHYPTDFKAMRSDALLAISLRGEQLTRLLLAHYCPEL